VSKWFTSCKRGTSQDKIFECESSGLRDVPDVAGEEIHRRLCRRHKRLHNGSLIMTHAGHSYASADPEYLSDIAESERAAATHAAARLRARCHDCEIVSVGSTPTLLFARHLEGVTEVRAGVSLFWDLAQLSRGMCTWEDLALAVERGPLEGFAARLAAERGLSALSAQLQAILDQQAVAVAANDRMLFSRRTRHFTP
jgi:Alanine racemase, N-terminal domain